MKNLAQSHQKESTYNSFEELSEIVHKNEEEIIADIKNKALKATLTALQPLLDKLEEASKQQAIESSKNQNPVLSYENQLERMQATALEKMKIQEQRIEARMKTLHNRMSKHQ